jgi:Mrp family chromosome partitioning ATPase
VENFSYVKCPDCGKEIRIFGESHVDEAAAELSLPVLARLPIDPALAAAADAGKFYETKNPYLVDAVEALK